MLFLFYYGRVLLSFIMLKSIRSIVVGYR